VQARYVHTNLIAENWQTLSHFYEKVFGCSPVPPERAYSGSELEKGTGLPGVGLSGVHLRLPGCGAQGPTLEIFQYAPTTSRTDHAVNQPGFTHLAFAVGSVSSARAEVLAAGGSAVGDVVVVTKPNGVDIEWCYVRDPEGNMIELQSSAV
jgi:predicted enzyme related to lactoylglutathione lyase